MIIDFSTSVYSAWIYLNPPINIQEIKNESKWKLMKVSESNLKVNESNLKVTSAFDERMNVHESSWTFGFYCHECPK